MAVDRLVGTVDAVTVKTAGPNAGKVAVKYLVGKFRKLDAGLARAVEQADFDVGGVRREQRKVRALAAPVGAKRPGKSFFDRTDHDCPVFLRSNERRHNLAS